MSAPNESNNYGAVPKRKKHQQDEMLFSLPATNFNVFLISYFIGLVVFLTTLIIFNTVLYSNDHLVFFWVAVVLACGVTWIVQSKTVFYRPIGAVCVLAIVIGSILGIYCYDMWGFFSYIYRNARQYTNVVPSEPAASVADAGRMTFAAEAFVEDAKSAGYAASNGVRYCVAPIRDMVKTTHVEFWAVGYNCCGWTGSFNCDAANDGNARGGIVVFDGPGIFATSNRDYYDMARKKAEAQFDLKSAKKPLYARWVESDNLNKLEKFYTYRTAGFIIASFFLYVGISFYFTSLGSSSWFKSYFDLD